ncbi:unnamed protein product [Strongylus vulgaris]|uniref:Uncharacterized protein n=1 Tax=Strongylus vulgaris TaxID=40348 RepID=A0A3P7IZC2_STRVU|nr:unnamed protein product [Strongylus vulgaris]
MQTEFVFGLLLAAIWPASSLDREKRCACAPPIPSPCSCEVGPTPFCSCKPIIPTPSCACGLRAQMTHCKAYCQEICQPACFKSWIPLPCPSFCGSLCSRSCLPKPTFGPVAPLTTSVILPYQCPTVCQQSCMKLCAVQLLPNTCMFMCQKPCVQKCVMASPVPHEFELMAEPAFPAAVPPPPPPFADAIPLPSAAPGCMGTGCMMDNVMPSMIDP